jgi:hypothetical protein
LRAVAESGKILPYHFNSLRSILEKTAIFFGRQHISTCFEGLPKKALYSRYLHVRSHAKYSVFEADSIHSKDKDMFREILKAFLEQYNFALSSILKKAPAPTAAPATKP